MNVYHLSDYFALLNNVTIHSSTIAIYPQFLLSISKFQRIIQLEDSKELRTEDT